MGKIMNQMSLKSGKGRDWGRVGLRGTHFYDTLHECRSLQSVHEC